MLGLSARTSSQCPSQHPEGLNQKNIGRAWRGVAGNPLEVWMVSGAGPA